MSQWQNKLDLTDVWERASENKISIQKLSNVIAERLRKLNGKIEPLVWFERDEIAYEFEELATNDYATRDDFDSVMEKLYDWSDISLDNKLGGKKVCWVAINF